MHQLSDRYTVGHAASATHHIPGGRIIGIEVARALAIIGMLAVHIGPTYDQSLAGRIYAMPHGRASILFVLIAGLGVSLLAASRRVSLEDARLWLLWTAAVLLPMGLALQTLDHNILVVLQTYGALFVLAAIVVSLPSRWLLGLAIAFAAIGPLIFHAGQVLAPDVFNRGLITPGQSPDRILHGLILSGPYPVITWAAPFLLGMWLGRCDLREPRTRLALVAGGVTAAIAALVLAAALQGMFGRPQWPIGWDHVIDVRPHSQMPFWLIGATGSALFILGLCLMIGDALGRLIWPLAALGQMALSFYVAHLLALHWWGRHLRETEPGAAAVQLLILTAAAVALAWAWRQVLPRGPLEMLLRAPWNLVREWQAGASR